MSEEEAVSTCENCKLKIASQNYVTHTLHCVRHLELCKKCGEPVPRDKLEEHMSLEHGNEACPTCGKTMEKGMLEKHAESDCPNRLVTCLHCELELPSGEMIDHADYCGTRTEKCSDCGEFVMLKYTQLHLDSNHKFLKLEDEPGPSASWEDKKSAKSIPKMETPENGESTLLPCEFCDGMFTPRELRRHQISCTNGWDTATPVLRTISTVKCRACGKTIAAKEYDVHLAVCEDEIPEAAGFLSAKKNDDNVIPCDVCERVVPFGEYDTHHRTCSKFSLPQREDRRKNSSVPCDVCDGSIPFQDYQRHRIFCVKPVTTDLPRRFTRDDSTPKLPCEFCEKSFSEDSLAAHQICCSPLGQRTRIPCEICGDLKSLIEVFEHQLKCRVSGDQL